MSQLCLQVLNSNFEQRLLSDRDPIDVPHLGITITADIKAGHALIESKGQTLETADGAQSQHPTIAQLNSELTILERNLSFVLLSKDGICFNRYAKSPKPVDLQLYIPRLSFRSPALAVLVVISLLLGNLYIVTINSHSDQLPTEAKPTNPNLTSTINGNAAFSISKPSPTVKAAIPKLSQSAQKTTSVAKASTTNTKAPSLTEEWRLFGEYQMEARFDPRKAKQKIIALSQKVPAGTKLHDRIQEFLSETM